MRAFELATEPGGVLTVYTPLPAGVEKLIPELVTLTLAEKSELWNTLHLPHHPSLLYRFKLLALADTSQVSPGARVEEVKLDIGFIPEPRHKHTTTIRTPR